MAQACATALALPELLSMIFDNINFYDLVRSRGVSQSWRKTIDDTSFLLQKLFIGSVPPTKFPKWRPRSQLVALDGTSDAFPVLIRDPSQGVRRTAIATILHPVLEVVEPESTFQQPHWRILQAAFARDRNIDDFFFDSEGSWRGMLLARPPPSKVVVTATIHDGKICSDLEVTAHNPAGVTLGNTMDAMQPSIDSLEQKGWFYLPKFAVATGEAEILGPKLHRKFREALEFLDFQLTIKGYISHDSPWIEMARRNTRMLKEAQSPGLGDAAQV